MSLQTLSQEYFAALTDIVQATLDQKHIVLAGYTRDERAKLLLEIGEALINEDNYGQEPNPLWQDPRTSNSPEQGDRGPHQVQPGPAAEGYDS
jgi:hypothetical protein